MSYRMLFILLQGVAGCGLVGWIYWAFMFSRAPRVPDATHVVAMNNHGAIIYFTQAEAAFGPTCGIVCLLAAAASMYFYKRADWSD
jgi:hypothetical protein